MTDAELSKLNFADIFNSRSESSVAVISSASPTAIIMRFVWWFCVNILKTAWTLVCASVIASAGMVWMHYDYGKKVFKAVVDIWRVKH